MDNGILAAGAQDIDFMIHGLFSYKIFGHEVWITTSRNAVRKRWLRFCRHDGRPVRDLTADNHADTDCLFVYCKA